LAELFHVPPLLTVTFPVNVFVPLVLVILIVPAIDVAPVTARVNAGAVNAAPEFTVNVPLIVVLTPSVDVPPAMMRLLYVVSADGIVFVAVSCTVPAPGVHVFRYVTVIALQMSVPPFVMVMLPVLVPLPRCTFRVTVSNEPLAKVNIPLPPPLVGLPISMPAQDALLTFTVTVNPPAMMTESADAGIAPLDQVVEALQLPLAIAVLVAPYTLRLASAVRAIAIQYFIRAVVAMKGYNLRACLPVPAKDATNPFTYRLRRTVN
jgi:hypothetical protein